MTFWLMAWVLTAGLLFITVGTIIWQRARHVAILEAVDDTVCKMRKVLADGLVTIQVERVALREALHETLSWIPKDSPVAVVIRKRLEETKNGDG